MPKLILSMDGLVLKEIPLDKERISIGRKSNNDIQIDNLAISGQHALITTILDDAFLEDLNSTNGTYVNGQPVKKHVLQSNDVVELGKYRLKFIADAAQENSHASDFTDTAALEAISVSPDADFPMRREPQPSASATHTQVIPPELRQAAQRDDAAGAGGRVGVIQVLSGTNAGRELVLSKSLVTLGKPGQQVAVITRRPTGYFITHVEGERFPLVNGRALDAQAHQLQDNDVLDIAGVKMAFYMRA